VAVRQPFRWRRAANSAAFSTSLIVVLVLAYLALSRVMEQPPQGSAASAESESVPAIELDRFTARRERSEEGERLSVSLRLRTTMAEPIDGFFFVVARNDHVTPHVWTIWPAKAKGLAITAGGHFHGATPGAGEPLSLTGRWERLNAVLPHPPGVPAYDTVVIYVVSAQGRILLSRPFRL
jgi:hypothetical protein